MEFAQLVTRQHTLVRIEEINEKKIRKAYDALLPKKLSPESLRILYCFEPLEIKPESKNGGFTVDGARALREMIAGVFNNRRSTIIVLAYERYGEAAQNALLKTIEEMPENVYLSLLYTPEANLLPTVQSRMSNITKSSPFQEKTSIDDFRQKLSGNQIIQLQKVFANADKLPNSWISDLLKAVKNKK